MLEAIIVTIGFATLFSSLCAAASYLCDRDIDSGDEI